MTDRIRIPLCVGSCVCVEIMPRKEGLYVNE